MPVCGRVRGTAFANEFALPGGGTLAIGFGKQRGLLFFLKIVIFAIFSISIQNFKLFCFISVKNIFGILMAAQPPGPARTHARTPSRSMGAPGRPSGPGHGQALAGLVLAVFGGRAGVSRPESGDRSCGSSTARPPTRGAARWPE